MVGTKFNACKKFKVSTIWGESQSHKLIGNGGSNPMSTTVMWFLNICVDCLAIFALLLSGGTWILQFSLIADLKSLEVLMSRMYLVGHKVLLAVSLCHKAN